MENINIKKKIVNFVRYHNAFVVMMVLAFVGIGGVFANEDIRDAVIGEEIIVEIQGLDNSAILACDLSAFDAMMRIVDVTGDTENYFVKYTYQTLAIEDNTWTEITRQETLNVSKAALEGRELGLYLIEELGEIVESELAFLKEVQENEMTKGETEVVEIIDTTGLLGLLSDIIIKYKPEPVAPPARPPVIAPVQVAPVAPVAAPAEVCAEFFYSEWGECQADGIQARTILTSLPEGCTGGRPSLAQTCDYVSGTDLDTLPDPVCAADHIDLCVSRELCAGIGLYWYSNVCNTEEQIILGCMDSTALNYNLDATEDDESCEYPSPTCVEFFYSEWGECQADGTQARTILTSLPDGCVDGNPVISQTCDYTPAPDSEFDLAPEEG